MHWTYIILLNILYPPKCESIVFVCIYFNSHKLSESAKAPKWRIQKTKNRNFDANRPHQTDHAGIMIGNRSLEIA